MDRGDVFLCRHTYQQYTTDNDGDEGFSDITRKAEAVRTGNTRAGRPTTRKGGA